MRKTILIFIFFFCVFYGQAQTLPSNRSVDWTLAGLRDTTTSGFSIIDMQAYGVIGDSISPNDSILTAVLNIYTDSNVILVFPNGIFLFNNTINISSNTIIKGQGPSNTTFKIDLGGSGNGINIQGTSINTDTTSLVQSATKDSSFIIVADTSIFSSKDWIRIIQVDSNLVTSSWARESVGQVVQIEQIVNNKFILSSPLRMDYNIVLSPYIQKINPIQNVGIECIKINRIDDTSPQHSSNITFRYTVNCWVNGIESQNCSFSHIKAEYSSNVSISKSYFHHAFDYGVGGRAYGVMLHYTTNECLVEDNIFKHLRHSMILQAGANGNVFSYNYSFDPYWSTTPNNSAGDMVLHGNYPYSNLFEQNICQNIVIDDSHGTNGPHNTFLRNRSESYGIFFSATNSPNQNFLGNDIPNTSFPYSFVNYTILGTGHFLHGNNNKGTINPIGTNALPDNSYVYTTKPLFVPISQWAGIGTPNTMGNASIPALDRYNSGFLFSSSCGNNITTGNKDEIQTNGVQIYPNPTTNFINIKSENNIKNIRITDIHGRLINDFSKIDGFSKIDISNIKNGLYFILILFTDNSFTMVKLIKINA